MYVVIQKLSDFITGLRAGYAEYGYVEGYRVASEQTIYNSEIAATGAMKDLQSAYPTAIFEVKELA